MSISLKDDAAVDNRGLHSDLTDGDRIDRENIARQDHEVSQFARSDRALHVVCEFGESRTESISAHGFFDADFLAGYPAVGVFAVQGAAGHRSEDALQRVKGRDDGAKTPACSICTLNLSVYEAKCLVITLS